MKLGEIASLVGGDLFGPPELEISGPGAIDAQEPGKIAFAVSPEYLAVGETSQIAALLLPRDLASSCKPYIHVDNPRAAFMALLQKVARPLPLSPGVHPSAIVDPSAKVSPEAQVGAYAVVEPGAQIAAGSRIYPFAYIGEGCEIAEGCIVYPHAVLYQRVRLCKGAIVHAGAVLGGDGFGYVWDGRQRVKVPQVGAVVIGEHCEIGALTAVDRATVGQTLIGDGTKIDNLVQVAHNVAIGQHCVIASQAGMAGSASIGDRVEVAGQVGVADHKTVVSDTKLAARSAVLQDIDEPGEYIGVPARPIAEGVRAMLLLSKLPDLFARLRKLEKRAGK